MRMQAGYPEARARHPERVQVQGAGSWLVRHRSVIIRHAVINVFLLTIILPLAWVLLLSIKSLPDSMTGRLWPRQFDFTHYAYVFNKIDTLPINLFNSIYVTAATVLITVFCAVLAGYALVHLRPRGGAFIVGLLIASLYFPTRVVSIITIYGIQDFLGLINSTSGLILPYITLNLAVSVLIMRSVFQLVPRELMDAAHIDGAGVWRTLWMVGLPLVRNGLVVVIIVNFVTAWGEYLLCTTLTNDQTVRTMPVVLAAAQGGMGQWAWPRIAAVYVIVVTPGIIAFAFAQRLFFKGLMEGVLKA
jgi:ABC-type glycerol-3-phosphate transport system permease component